ncbi:MAG: hypothetical protein CMN76_19270 [Spirochaetaceae bacterium]|nr:hypothetical protein [Spirochaetaceae bacterium]|tara:strand:+ start:56941 stop:57558 length:618 start_codon:yes stop_codon:yes gene_type:complete
MRTIAKYLIGALFFLAALVFLGWYFLPAAFDFSGPHQLHRQRAYIQNQALLQALGSEDSNLDLEETIQASLEFTTGHLEPGLYHNTSLIFSDPRPGNCIEYSHLFAQVFNLLATKNGLNHRAYIIRSNARFLGMRIPLPGFADHDWVFVGELPLDAPNKAARIQELIESDSNMNRYVDAMFYDAFFRWNVEMSLQQEGTTVINLK